MGKVLVPRAIDRSKYPKTMMYVDGKGNICGQDKRVALSDEEKVKRAQAKKDSLAQFKVEKNLLVENVRQSKAKSKKELSVVNTEALLKAQKDLDEFKKTGFTAWRKRE